MTTTSTVQTRFGKKTQLTITPTTAVATPSTPLSGKKPTENMAAGEDKNMQTVQAMFQTLQETIMKNQEMMFKSQEEIKRDTGEMRIELMKMGERMDKLQNAVKKNEEKIQATDEKVSKIEGKMDRMEINQELTTKEIENELIILEMEKSAFYLRFQNVVEDKEENLKDLMAEIVAGLMKNSKELIIGEIDEAFRIQTNYARRFNLPREVHVRFNKKSLREEILKKTKEEQPVYKGKSITILKQIPRRVRESRRKYQFLTSQLIKDNVWYRWLIPEGIMVTWQERRIRIDNIQDARDFYEEHYLITDEQEGEEEEEESKSQDEKDSQDHETGQRDRNGRRTSTGGRQKTQRELRQERRNNPRYR